MIRVQQTMKINRSTFKTKEVEPDNDDNEKEKWTQVCRADSVDANLSCSYEN